MRGITKIHFVRVNSGPFRAQSARQIAAHSRSDDLDNDQPDDGALIDGRGRRATFDQGETENKPSPAPNTGKISDNAAATNAPAITAAQDTPDEYASFLTKLSANPS